MMATSGCKCSGRLVPAAQLQLQLVVVMVLVGSLRAHTIVEIDPKGPTAEVKATYITFKNNLRRDAVKCTQSAPLLGKENSVVVPPSQSRTIRKNSLGTATRALQRMQLRFEVCHVEYLASPAPVLTRALALGLTPTITILEVGICEGKPGLKFTSGVVGMTTYVGCARPVMKNP